MSEQHLAEVEAQKKESASQLEEKVLAMQTQIGQLEAQLVEAREDVEMNMTAAEENSRVIVQKEEELSLLRKQIQEEKEQAEKASTDLRAEIAQT